MIAVFHYSALKIRNLKIKHNFFFTKTCQKNYHKLPLLTIFFHLLELYLRRNLFCGKFHEDCTKNFENAVPSPRKSKKPFTWLTLFLNLGDCMHTPSSLPLMALSPKLIHQTALQVEHKSH